MLNMRTFILPFTFSALLMVVAPAGATSADWPSQIVKLEDLQPLTRFRFVAPGIVVRGRITGPAILKAHIASDGSVVRTMLLSSCGNSNLDEAALHGMREMRFAPYTLDDEPTEVSMVVPVHIPKNWGRRD
ncbi:MAG: TonB family protein [Proteobacteria bacterium]|nr:TonB family protein [Pseudomonadota bacterium]